MLSGASSLKEPLIAWYDPGRRSGEQHQGESSVLVKGMCRAKKQAFTRQSSALSREDALNVSEHVPLVKCHSCAGHTEPVSKEKENGWQSGDYNFYLSMKCVDNPRKRRNRNIHVAVHIAWQLKTEL